MGLTLHGRAPNRHALLAAGCSQVDHQQQQQQQQEQALEAGQAAISAVLGVSNGAAVPQLLRRVLETVSGRARFLLALDACTVCVDVQCVWMCSVRGV